MLKSSKPETHDHLAAANGAKAGHRLREMNRVTVRDHCAGAEREFFTNGRNRSEHQQPFDMRVVFAFHPVGLKN